MGVDAALSSTRVTTSSVRRLSAPKTAKDAKMKARDIQVSCFGDEYYAPAAHESKAFRVLEPW